MTGIVVGWGRTSEGGTLASVIQEVQVPILTLSQCRNSKYKPSRITANMLCAGKGVQDSCQVYIFLLTRFYNYLLLYSWKKK